MFIPKNKIVFFNYNIKMEDNDFIRTKSKKRVKYEFVKPTSRSDYLPKEDVSFPQPHLKPSGEYYNTQT